MRFSRKPLAAPAQDYKTARPPSRHRIRGGARGSIICGNYQTFPEITQSRFRGFVIFLRLVVHGRTYKNWESNSRLLYEVLHPNAKTPETVKNFFSTYARCIRCNLHTSDIGTPQFKFCKLSKNGSRELGGGAVLGLLKNCFCLSRQLALFGRDIGVWLIFSEKCLTGFYVHMTGIRPC